MSKICSKCKIKKSLDQFFKNNTGPQGRHSSCKVCFPSKGQFLRKKLAFLKDKPEYYFGMIYKLTNLVTNKSYIGQTILSLKIRTDEHRKKSNGCPRLRNSIQKHGWKNFIAEELYYSFSFADLNKKELFFIKYFDTFNNGYNLAIGGRETYTHSEETRKKQSLSKIGNKNHRFGKDPWNKGKKLHYLVGQRKEILWVDKNIKFNSIKDASEQLGISIYIIKKAVKGIKNNKFNEILQYV